MSRRLPRSFFWIDQGVIRSGVWLRLSAEARLAYIALAASCDREGLSIWSSKKLMELASCQEREHWDEKTSELEAQGLIERVPEHSPPAIRLREIETSAAGSGGTPVAKAIPAPPAPIIVHTHTTIHLGGKPTHVESGNAD